MFDSSILVTYRACVCLKEQTLPKAGTHSFTVTHPVACLQIPLISRQLRKRVVTCLSVMSTLGLPWPPWRKKYLLQSSERPSHFLKPYFRLFLLFISPDIEVSICFIIYEFNLSDPVPGLYIALLTQCLLYMHEALGVIFTTIYTRCDDRCLHSQHFGR